MFKNIMDRPLWMSALWSLLFGMLGCVLVQLVFIKPQPTIATVNITGLVDGYVKNLAKGQLSRAQKEARIKQFGSELSRHINQLAHDQHLILLPSEAVMAGSVDMTNVITTRLNQGA